MPRALTLRSAAGLRVRTMVALFSAALDNRAVGTFHGEEERAHGRDGRRGAHDMAREGSWFPHGAAVVRSHGKQVIRGSAAVVCSRTESGELRQCGAPKMASRRV